MLLNSADGLFNNNTQGVSPSLKNQSEFSNSNNTDNSPLLNCLINNSERGINRSMPVPSDSKGALMEYRQLMINWHKDLKRQNPHPYKTFADAMNVSFFTLHLV